MSDFHRKQVTSEERNLIFNENTSENIIFFARFSTIQRKLSCLYFFFKSSYSHMQHLRSTKPNWQNATWCAGELAPDRVQRGEIQNTCNKYTHIYSYSYIDRCAHSHRWRLPVAIDRRGRAYIRLTCAYISTLQWMQSIWCQDVTYIVLFAAVDAVLSFIPAKCVVLFNCVFCHLSKSRVVFSRQSFFSILFFSVCFQCIKCAFLYCLVSHPVVNEMRFIWWKAIVTITTKLEE